MRQNTHTGSLNDLPNIPVISEMAIFWLHSYIFKILDQIWQNNVFVEIAHAIKWFSKAVWAKWPEEAWKHFMLFVKNWVCYRKNHSNLILFRGPPYLSTYCLNNSFFHEQLLWQSVLIFSYMQALGSSGISLSLFHEITRSWHTHQTIRLDELVWTEQVSARVMETFVEFSINMFENLVFWTKCD